MNTAISKMPIELIHNKVKVVLSLIGLNEKYSSFNYLAFIITYMIENDTESLSSFNAAIEIIKNKHQISKLSIIYCLKKLTDQCNEPEITNKTQYNLNRNTILNRTRILKEYILEKF